jgi:1-acyl-sn-glycerol-3-phosphate acyltransferase
MWAEPSLVERVHGSPALARRQRLGSFLCHALGRMDVSGLDRVPAHGPVILAANHRALWDGVVLFSLTERPVTCLVKREAFLPGLGRLMISAGQLPVRRDAIDPGPVRSCLRVLNAGGVVGIFPEGTRGDGRVAQVKPGVGYLALRTGATVVPVALDGTAQLVRTLRRQPVRIRIGTPIAFSRHPEHQPLNRRLSREAAELVRVELAALVAAPAQHTDHRVPPARPMTPRVDGTTEGASR